MYPCRVPYLAWYHLYVVIVFSMYLTVSLPPSFSPYNVMYNIVQYKTTYSSIIQPNPTQRNTIESSPTEPGTLLYALIPAVHYHNHAIQKNRMQHHPIISKYMPSDRTCYLPICLSVCLYAYPSVCTGITPLKHPWEIA